MRGGDRGKVALRTGDAKASRFAGMDPERGQAERDVGGTAPAQPRLKAGDSLRLAGIAAKRKRPATPPA